MSEHGVAVALDVFVPDFEAGKFLTCLDAEGMLLMQAADSRGLDEQIAHCPGWTVRELVAHVGFVYRWVSVIVGEERGAPTTSDERAALEDPDPADGVGSAARLAAARVQCLAALRAAAPDLACWTTWPTSMAARDFWIRRMVHETLIHRIDAQNAGGAQAVGGAEIATTWALDGIDEMMLGFAGRYAKRLRHEDAATLVLTTTDTGHRWWARIGPDAPEFGRGTAPTPSDTEILGSSGALLLWLWNRGPREELEFRGQSHLPATWAREAHL